MPLTSDADIRALLQGVRTIAVVGASDNALRASNEVMAMLKSHGYRVIPVNPRLVGGHIHGEPVRADLSQIDGPIDLVDIFRNSDDAGDSVDEAIAVGAGAVWMQLDVINEAAANRAEAAGLKVVMDRCPKIEIRRLGIAPL